MSTAELTKLVDLVARVHGDAHPHLAEVQERYHRVDGQLASGAPADREAVRADLAQIRELSDDFQTPADGCEGYQMMNHGLAQFVDQAEAQIR
jgi:iron-sulfur cluster repair protein YtfE (RIC family)